MTQATIQIEDIALEEVFAAQQKQALQWRTSTAAQRIQLLKALKTEVEQHEDALIHALYADFKKPAEEVKLTELAPFYMEINHTIKHLHRWMKPKAVANHFPFLLGKSQIQYQAKGNVLVIAPWNYPFQLSMNPLVTAIAAGNTVMLKPSEFTPNTSKLIAEIIHKVFDPAQVRVYLGDAEMSKRLLKLPFNHIFFTGSPAVGREVMRAAATHLADITLELGGKSPVFIDESADLLSTAEKLVWGKLLNGGQTCIAPDYVLVNDAMIPALTDALKTAINTQYGTTNLNQQQAAVISLRHYQRLKSLLHEALEQGAQLVTGGQFDDETLRIAPTIISGVNDQMRIMHEEIFGPILPVVGVKHSQEAVHYINDHPKPLALYIFSRNDYKNRQILAQTSSGGSCINDLVVHITNPDLPFGGINQSGIGHYHGEAGFRTFSHSRSVFSQFNWFNINRFIYPPYTPTKSKLIAWLLKIIK
ncbi:MAG: aldehyde dehydrogenase family protein [Bacteroidia bacterium]